MIIKIKFFVMNSLYKSFDIDKNEEEYILEINDPNESLFYLGE